MTPADGVKFLMLQMIPCILHMETRVGIKILTLILQDGLSNAKWALLSCTSSANGETAKEIVFKKNDDLFNYKILGDNVNKYQYDLPLELDPNGAGRRLGIINFETLKFERF